MEWIPEKVLQKYVQKNKEKFAKHFDGNITSVIWNNDRYSDLTFVIDGDREIPVEVEWKTSNFIQHKHPPEILLEGNGLVIVGKIEPELISELDKTERADMVYEKYMSQMITIILGSLIIHLPIYTYFIRKWAKEWNNKFAN